MTHNPDMWDEVQPLPSSLAREVAHHRGYERVYGDGTGPDPRLACWFCGQESVALAPRHSGGDVNLPSHWLPICEDHIKGWKDEEDMGDGLPVIPRNGVALSKEQAESVLARISYYVENNDVGVDEAEVDAYHALATGLAALNTELESEHDND